VEKQNPNEQKAGKERPWEGHQRAMACVDLGLWGLDFQRLTPGQKEMQIQNPSYKEQHPGHRPLARKSRKVVR
jgi:hypothetical protein